MAERPVYEVLIGAINRTIWKNETEKGTRSGATLGRVHQHGDRWHSTDSSGWNHLLLLANVADTR